MESRDYTDSKLSGNELERFQTRRRGDEDLDSNVSYNSNDEDPILTATITFDVTVDPNGQVISTTEGQIIAEGIQKQLDGRTLNLLEHNPIPLSQITSSNELNPGFQADSLTSMNSMRQSKDVTTTVLQDSLDEPETDTDEDSTSTSTESLIERSKKYMNQEAGIIILKRDNPVSKNFNINLDFDLSNNPDDTSRSILNSRSGDDDGKNFNINLDFDIKNSNSELLDTTSNDPEKAFNINLDFDINNPQKRAPQNSRKTGVDIDLMITSSTTTSKVEEKVSNETFDEIKSIDYWRAVNRDGPNDKSFDPNAIENETPWEDMNRSDSAQNYQKFISDESFGGYHYINNSMSESVRPMDSNSDTRNLEEENARYELIDRIVQKATNKQNSQDKDSYYKKQLPKVGKFNIDDCIEAILDESKDQNASKQDENDYTVLRTFETIDLDALTKGFEPEEIKEGKLVLYITEAQLLQLLKQRAIVVPNTNTLNEISKKNFSLVDEKVGSRLGRKTPIREVELVVNQEQDNNRPTNPLSKISEKDEDRSLTSDSSKGRSGREKPGSTGQGNNIHNLITDSTRPGTSSTAGNVYDQQKPGSSAGGYNTSDQYRPGSSTLGTNIYGMADQTRPGTSAAGNNFYDQGASQPGTSVYGIGSDKKRPASGLNDNVIFEETFEHIKSRPDSSYSEHLKYNKVSEQKRPGSNYSESILYEETFEHIRPDSRSPKDPKTGESKSGAQSISGLIGKPGSYAPGESISGKDPLNRAGSNLGPDSSYGRQGDNVSSKSQGGSHLGPDSSYGRQGDNVSSKSQGGSHLGPDSSYGRQGDNVSSKSQGGSHLGPDSSYGRQGDNVSSKSQGGSHLVPDSSYGRQGDNVSSKSQGGSYLGPGSQTIGDILSGRKDDQSRIGSNLGVDSVNGKTDGVRPGSQITSQYIGKEGFDNISTKSDGLKSGSTGDYLTGKKDDSSRAGSNVGPDGSYGRQGDNVSFKSQGGSHLGPGSQTIGDILSGRKDDQTRSGADSSLGRPGSKLTGEVIIGKKDDLKRQGSGYESISGRPGSQFGADSVFGKSEGKPGILKTDESGRPGSNVLNQSQHSGRTITHSIGDSNNYRSDYLNGKIDGRPATHSIVSNLIGKNGSIIVATEGVPGTQLIGSNRPSINAGDSFFSNQDSNLNKLFRPSSKIYNDRYLIEDTNKQGYNYDNDKPNDPSKKSTSVYGTDGHRPGSDRSRSANPQDKTGNYIYEKPSSIYNKDNLHASSLSNINQSYDSQQPVDKRFDSIYSGTRRPTNSYLPDGRASLSRFSDIFRDLAIESINELEKFSNRLSASMKSNQVDNQKIDWPSVQSIYNTPEEQEKAKLMKRFVSSLLEDHKPKYLSKPLSADENESLKALDEFVEHVLNKNKRQEPENVKALKLLDHFIDRVLTPHMSSAETLEKYKPFQHISDKEALDLINDLIRQLKNNLFNWKSSRRSESTNRLSSLDHRTTGHKIIIKTTRKLPAKVLSTSTSNVADCKQQQLLKKKITYSYLDNKYDTTTRVYEVSTPNSKISAENVAHAADLFNSNNTMNYSVKSFDPLIADSIGKPSVEQINKYLSVVNTGVKNTDLIQIHPLLNNRTEIKTKLGPDSVSSIPTVKEPVIIDSTNYPKYVEDVSKHFGGLQVTDFPLYVQGLEFRQNSNKNSDLAQSVVYTKQKAHSEGLQAGETVAKQTVNNLSNVQYVRVNNPTPSVSAAH